ncbi:DUF7162 family protein [Mycobacterium antarcticum]|uniref:DUF7162 family protein n=1 Tax=Mycolicibacterium sp. TUM20984 TaxID=3023368 RepID=UPI0024E16C2C|nr:hypothetical protein [Mycolicibacterium sp. TUM20984]
MGTVRMDAEAVRALADRVLDGADRLDEIRWPTLASAAVAGSAVGAATEAGSVQDRVADVAARMRTWASAVQTSVASIERAELDHRGRLDGSR